MRTSVLNTVLAMALVAGAACKGPDKLTDPASLDRFTVVARGANIIPTPTAEADTAAEATALMVTTGGTELRFHYHVGAYPAGASVVDSIFLYTLAASAANYTIGGTGATTYVAPSARLCGSSVGTAATGLAATLPPACAPDVDLLGVPTTVTAANGNITTNTAASITTSARAYGQSMVFFTTGASNKRGKIRGTLYVTPD